MTNMSSALFSLGSQAKKASRKTILITDDTYVDRVLLNKTFSDDYRVLTAENGIAAMNILRRNSDIAAVVLDIMMPGKNGYTVIREMSEDPKLCNIPVIVITASSDDESQIKALELGAQDVLTKPFSPQIVRRRVINIIEKTGVYKLEKQNVEYRKMLLRSEIDEKTGINNKRAFCRKTNEIISQSDDKKYIICRWDIDNFKVFNDIFGVAAGDSVLRAIGDYYNADGGKKMLTCGHLEADHFVMCYDRECFSEQEIQKKLKALFLTLNYEFEFVPRLGIYCVDDTSVDVSLMCDRALLALRSVKHDYKKAVAYYEPAMLTKLIEEQKLVGEMSSALQNGQFVVYYQPQINYIDNSLYGAEALVRWNHPLKGLIAPSEFIPAFEKNGFINHLDNYVWEEVCAAQRRWLDAGYSIIPISVNISRLDIYNPHLCRDLCAATKKYSVDNSYLRIEITESAYMNNREQLINAVEGLRSCGFIVEMDDFGSGYSSLNMLKDVPVDILKMDMEFLKDSSENPKTGKILSSVIRMASWLDIPVIAEGVETKEQADYLKSIDCMYLQGYYFALPMPEKEFEAILSGNRFIIPKENRLQEHKESHDYLDDSSQVTRLFNSCSGGAQIVECDGSNVEILRVNDRFFEITGIDRENFKKYRKNVLDCLYPESAEIYKNTLEKAEKTCKEVSCEIMSHLLDDKKEVIWMRIEARFLARRENRSIFYTSIENITENNMLHGAVQQPEITEHRIATSVLACKQNVVENIIVNLTRDTLTVYNSLFIKSDMPYKQALEKLCKRVYTSEQSQNVRNVMSADNLIMEYGLGNSIILLEYQRYVHENDAIPRWVRTIINNYRNPKTGDIESFQYTVNIDQETVMSNIAASLAENYFEMFAVLYPAEGYMRFYKCSDYERNLEIGTDNHYIPILREFIERHVAEEMLADAYTILSIDNIVTNINKTGRYSFVLKEYNNEKTEYKRYECGWLNQNKNAVYMLRSDVADKENNRTDNNELSSKIDRELPNNQNDKSDKINKWQPSLSVLLAKNTIYLEVNLTKDLIEHEENLGLENEAREGISLTDYIKYGCEKMTYCDDIEEFCAFFNPQRLISLYEAGRSSDQFEYRAIIDGRPQWYHTDVHIMCCPDSGDIKAYIIYRNIDDVRSRYQELEAVAMHDSMTHLLNRSGLENSIRERMENMDDGNQFALLMIDLDNLKTINDTYGHIRGDEAIIATADSVRATFSESIVGRIGGDEFMVFSTNMDISETKQRADRLLSVLREKSKGVILSASIGIVTGVGKKYNFAQLYGEADRALYEAKRNGKNQYKLTILT